MLNEKLLCSVLTMARNMLIKNTEEHNPFWTQMAKTVCTVGRHGAYFNHLQSCLDGPENVVEKDYTSESSSRSITSSLL